MTASIISSFQPFTFTHADTLFRGVTPTSDGTSGSGGK
jgi:hypothetical protein